MLARLYMHRYGAISEDLGAVAINARRWAQLNPNAALRAPLTIEDYLASPLIADPLRKADICLVSDGAGAMVLTRVERARDVAPRPVLVRGFGDAYLHHMTPFGTGDWLDDCPLATCAERALAMAQIGRHEVSLVQIYDAFTINVLVALEAMGFCAAGEAGAFVRTGAPGPGGKLPINTSGGGLAFNHSGQFGMQLCIEAVRQLRGECGARQVEGACRCLVQATGMVMSAYMVMVLATD
jgi:acetyl-CoA C-acetyltransferase